MIYIYTLYIIYYIYCIYIYISYYFIYNYIYIYYYIIYYIIYIYCLHILYIFIIHHSPGWNPIGSYIGSRRSGHFLAPRVIIVDEPAGRAVGFTPFEATRKRVHGCHGPWEMRKNPIGSYGRYLWFNGGLMGFNGL